MRYLLNLLYVLILSLAGLCALIPRFRRNDVLGGFVDKFLGRAPEQSRLKFSETLGGRGSCRAEGEAAPQEPRAPGNTDSPVVWLHAVSVGEALLCRPVLDGLRSLCSNLKFVLSVSTPDAFQIATHEYPDVDVFYAPYDFTWSVRRACRKVNPVLFIISENDIWPNLIREVGERGVPIAVFNTRMSTKEQNEHRWNGWLIRPSLRCIHWWGAVTQSDADWIARLFGVPSPPVEVTGSMKFDGILRDRDNPETAELRRLWQIKESDCVLVAGSTHAPEEEILLTIFRQLSPAWPRLKLILVPRNSERFDVVAELLDRNNVDYQRTSASTGSNPDSVANDTRVILVDTVGQLRHAWGLGQMAFVGGSLCEGEGGHNMIEPASYGIPVCFGPDIETFQTVVDIFLAANAAIQTESPTALQTTLEHWLNSPSEAAEMGQRARQVVTQQSHAVEMTLQRIAALLPNQYHHR
jgi:3-deoxy-D-manno-octulosonic-acid transferase